MAKSYSTSSVESQMIWGCQYDMAARWLEKSGYNIDNSTEWGNYQDASFKYLGSVKIPTGLICRKILNRVGERGSFEEL